MKTIRILLLAFMAVTFCSCDNDEDVISKSDFSVLGISSVTVNDATYNVGEDLLWVTDAATPFYISATEMTTATKHCVIEYVVSATDDNSKEVSAASTYSDVSIAVSSDTTTAGIVYKVIEFTRPNYNEQLTYKIFFANIEY